MNNTNSPAKGRNTYMLLALGLVLTLFTASFIGSEAIVPDFPMLTTTADNIESPTETFTAMRDISTIEVFELNPDLEFDVVVNQTTSNLVDLSIVIVFVTGETFKDLYDLTTKLELQTRVTKIGLTGIQSNIAIELQETINQECLPFMETSHPMYGQLKMLVERLRDVLVADAAIKKSPVNSTPN